MNPLYLSHLVILLLALAAGWGTRCSATIISADSFEEYSIGPLSGASGGTGWAGAWGAPVSTALANVVNASANPLTFTPVGGLPVNAGTNAVEVFSSPIANAIASSRQVAGPLPDVFYLSYLARIEAGDWTTAGAGANTFSLHFSDTAANTTSLNVGLRAATTGSEFMVRNGTGTPVAGALAGGQVQTGTNYFIVVRLSKRGISGAPTTRYDRAEFWVNPAGDANLTATNGNARLQLGDNTGLASVDYILVRQAALEAEDRAWFDHVVIGANWEDVVPLPPDTNAPVVTVASPANSALYAPGIPVDVAATVTDDRGVALVQLFTNGVVVQTDSVAPYFFSLGSLPVGPHTLTVVASDAVSNLGSNSVSIMVTNSTGDTTPPFVSITSLTNGQNLLLGVSAFVSAAITDNVAVAYAEIYADNVLGGSRSVAPYEFTISNLTVGAHTLAVRGVDISGNAATNIVSITVYTNAPATGTTILLSDTFNGFGPTGTAAPGTYLSTGIDVPSSGTLAPSIANNTTTPGALNLSVLYTGTLTGNQDFDGSFSFTKDGTNAFNFGPSLVGQRWALTFTAKTTGTTAVDKFYVGVSDTNVCLGEVGYDIAVQMASGSATNEGQGIKILTNAFAPATKINVPNATTPLSGNVLHTYSLTVDETGPLPNFSFQMDGTNYLATNTSFAAFSTTNRYLVFNVFDRAVGAVNIGQLNDVKLEVLVPPGPPLTEFHSCSALPAFFAGMNLVMITNGGVNFSVWSSSSVGPSVTNWTMEGVMIETPLNDNTGRSRYALNVIPASSPAYYVISTTNTPPYAGSLVPVHWITTDINTGEYTFFATNTTISTGGVLGLNTAPTATADNATTPEDVAVTINVLANDTDADPNSVLSLLSASSGNGTANIVGTNVLYVPAPNFHGTNAISYVMTDGGLLVTGAVTVVVTAVNDAPAAVADTASTPQDTPVTINVLFNDSDVDGDSLVLAGVTAGSGNASIDGTNVLFMPATGFSGTNVFNYVVTDGSLAATGQVVVVVTPLVLVPPILSDIFLNPDHSVTIGFSVPPGQTYRVEATTNLAPPVFWNGVLTNISSSTNKLFLTETNTAEFRERFYRVSSP